ncbi:MAG: hypothetical protein IPQ26_08785 [Elusimicrobia bacterium]|nr:hypothetical protein [Elusimicrobiota bacterium]
MKNTLSRLWRALVKPVDGTPNFVKHTPSLESVRRGAAVAMAVVVFYTQSVCAGTASLPLLPVSKRPVVAGQLGLLDRLMKFVGADKKGSAYKFHDNVWNDRRKLTGEATEPGLDPKSLEKMVANQEARRDIENQNRHNRGYQELEKYREQYKRSAGELVANQQMDGLEGALTPGDLAAATVKEVMEAIKVKMKSLFGAMVEFKMDVKKNYDGTYQRTYLIDGRASRIYNSKTRNPHGQLVTQNITNMRYNRSHVLISMDIEHKDVKGLTSYTHRKMDYHDGAKAMVPKTQLVKKLDEWTVTPQGEKTELHRWDIQYDGAGNMKKFDEFRIDENGVKTEKWWWGGEYDGDKNLLKYDELTRSRGLDTHVTWEATDYEVNERWDARKEAGETDSWGRSSHHLTGYKKTTTGPDGKVELDVFTNLGYDEFENMIHYDREATDFQGKVMNVVWDGEYDKFDRAAAYKQTTTDAFGHTQVLEFSGGEYNVYDDLLAYTEKTTENGETKSRVFTNGVFDTKHNMMSYREEATDSKGRTSIKEWNAVGAGKGYVLGELQGYDEVVNYGALVVTSEVRNIHYDALRRQDGNATTKRIKGVETDGGAVDIVLVEDTRVMRSDEARSVRAVGSTDPRSMNIVNVVGGRTEVRTRGRTG